MAIEKKILVCGDLHTKIHILDRVIEQSKDYDRVIFLGDYVDEWNASPDASFNLLRRLINFKKENEDKVVLCYGNHDASYAFGGNFRCSGFNPITKMLVEDLFLKNQELFNVSYEEADILFTHAGLTNGWVKDNKLEGHDAKSYSEALEHAFRNRGVDDTSNHIFKALSTAGGARGGIHSPSPLWADYTELIADSVPHITQVVGHTPSRSVLNHTVTNGDGTKHNLFFCDTHSLYRDGENIGDNTLLEITTFNNDEPLFTIIPL